MDFRVIFAALLVLTTGGFAQSTAETAAAQALAKARQTVANEPKNGAAHVALAIALGKMTDFTDNRTKMSYARLIRAEAEIGLQLDPQNTEACLVLGKWHDEMARLNPVLRAAATALYGRLPEASLVEAEKYLRRATRNSPEGIQPRGELAEFLERQKRPDEAHMEWKKILRLKPRDAIDRAFMETAKRR